MLALPGCLRWLAGSLGASMRRLVQDLAFRQAVLECLASTPIAAAAPAPVSKDSETGDFMALSTSEASSTEATEAWQFSALWRGAPNGTASRPHCVGVPVVVVVGLVAAIEESVLAEFGQSLDGWRVVAQAHRQRFSAGQPPRRHPTSHP